MSYYIRPLARSRSYLVSVYDNVESIDLFRMINEIKELSRGNAQSIIIDWKIRKEESIPIMNLLLAMEEEYLLTGTIFICIGISIPKQMDSNRERLQKSFQMAGSIEEAIERLNTILSELREKTKRQSQNMFDHDLELGDLRHYGFERNPK